jgi:hypothetical protein
MRDDFNFEQSQLINNFFMTPAKVLTKESMIERLVNAIANTDDENLISIAESTICKIRFMNEKAVQELLECLPIGEGC